MRLVIDAPTPQPRKFGLYSVADVTTAEPHALMGVEFEKNDNCIALPGVSTTNWCSTQPAKSAVAAYAGTTTFDMFNLYSVQSCAAPGGAVLAKAQADAVRKFGYGEERGVEKQLEAALNATVGFVTPGGAPTTITGGIALIEQYLDTVYAGRGIILMSREAATYAIAARVVSQHGDHLETELGTFVAASAQFGGGPSGPTAGKTWIKTVGSVQVRRGAMSVHGPLFLGGTNATDNTSHVLVERQFVTTYDCVVAGLQATLA